MRDLLPCPPCGRQGRPDAGFLAGSNTEEPRGSAPRERDHRGGDHPVPSRTRQLSPPSPRVLQRKAAGGQGVALAEGAFLVARGPARRTRRRPAGGIVPLRAFSRSGPMAIRTASACGPWLRPGGDARRRAGGRSPRCRRRHREAFWVLSAQAHGPRVHARDTFCGLLKGSGGRRYIALRC